MFSIFQSLSGAFSDVSVYAVQVGISPPPDVAALYPELRMGEWPVTERSEYGARLAALSEAFRRWRNQQLVPSRREAMCFKVRVLPAATATARAEREATKAARKAMRIPRCKRLY